jgi:hypothetical protein
MLSCVGCLKLAYGEACYGCAEHKLQIWNTYILIIHPLANAQQALAAHGALATVLLVQPAWNAHTVGSPKVLLRQNVLALM